MIDSEWEKQRLLNNEKEIAKLEGLKRLGEEVSEDLLLRLKRFKEKVTEKLR